MPDWLDALRSDLDAELGHKPKVATLSTVDGAEAAARSVVVRHWTDAGSATFTSDARSDKNRQLRANPSASLVFWLAGRNRQYRLAGTVAIVPAGDPRRLDQWRRGSDSARALFAWPPCGEPRDTAGAFPAAVSADAAMPDNFEVLTLTPARVEVLDLSHTPHLRQRWAPSGDAWTCQVVNP